MKNGGFIHRLAFPLYVCVVCGFAGILSDVGHIPAYVYEWLGRVPPDYWLGRPLEIPFLLVSRYLYVLSGTCLVGFYTAARFYIAWHLSRDRIYVKVADLESFDQ